MKKKITRKLALKRKPIATIQNVKGGLQAAQTCLGIICPETMFIVCPAR